VSILNKRNAVLGWAVWQVSKRAATRKAKQAVPSRAGDKRRPNKGAIASALAVVGGAVWFLRRKRGDDGS
jgi:hypothetical protein